MVVSIAPFVGWAFVAYTLNQNEIIQRHSKLRIEYYILQRKCLSIFLKTVIVSWELQLHWKRERERKRKEPQKEIRIASRNQKEQMNNYFFLSLFLYFFFFLCWTKNQKYKTQ